MVGSCPLRKKIHRNQNRIRDTCTEKRERTADRQTDGQSHDHTFFTFHSSAAIDGRTDRYLVEEKIVHIVCTVERH